MPSESMDQEMVDALSSAQQGKDILAEMVVDLETQLDQTKSDKAAAYLDNSTLANEVRRFEGKLVEVTEERDKLLQSNAQEKSAFSTTIDELNGQLDSLQFDKEAAQKALRRAEDATRLERNNLDEQLRKSHKFNDDLNEQLAGKEIELARASGQASEAKHVSRSERQMRELFEGHLGEAKNHQDHLRVRMRELEAEAADATQQYQKATDTIYSMQDQMTEVKQQKADALKAARSDHAMLTAEISGQKVEMATLDRDNNALNKAVEELRKSLDSRSTELTQTKEAKALTEVELARAKAKLADANMDETLLCSQIDQLKDTIKMFSTEKNGLLQQKSGDKETYMEELRVLRGALNIAQNNTEAALTQVRTEKNTMVCDIAEISEQLERARAELTSVTNQLDTTEGTVATVMADKEELEAERRFLSTEKAELEVSLQKYRVEAETKSIEVRELEQLMRTQEAQINDDRADMHRTKGDNTIMLRDHDEIRSTFEKLRDENELLTAQVSQLQDHIGNSEVRMRQLELQAGQVPGLQAAAATAAAGMDAAQAQAFAAQAGMDAAQHRPTMGHPGYQLPQAPQINVVGMDPQYAHMQQAQLEAQHGQLGMQASHMQQQAAMQQQQLGMQHAEVQAQMAQAQQMQQAAQASQSEVARQAAHLQAQQAGLATAAQQLNMQAAQQAQMTAAQQQALQEQFRAAGAAQMAGMAQQAAGPQIVHVPVPVGGPPLGQITAQHTPNFAALTPELQAVVGENERFRDRVMALEEELAQTKAASEVDRSILEEQLHHAEARAEKSELVDEIEDKLRASLEEIARLESEMLNTRAEAAERDIQWQAEVDALAETYHLLQAELKQRERDIEEMKEGAWLSAELQYMAKKVEEMESEARGHVGEQRRQLESLEDTEVELAKMRAERDELCGQIRALDEEINDEKLANKDLLCEVSSLRDELSRAIAEKEKALEAAENYLKRTLEGQNADRDTLKGALKELGSSLETIRSDKERALNERDDQLASQKTDLAQTEKDLAEAMAANGELEKALALSQQMLKAALISSSTRFGATIANYRGGLIRFGMQQWKGFMVAARSQSRIEELEYRVMLLQDAGKMIALKRIIGRWKNQQLHAGWQVWRVFMEERDASGRLDKLLANMTAEQRKRSLERLNAIISVWLGDSFKARWHEWKTEVREGKQRKKKMGYFVKQMGNRKIAMGFHTWHDFALLSAEERAQYEIDELRWIGKHANMNLARAQLQYVVVSWARFQRQRLFGNWKNVTHAVARVVQKVHLILGSIHRVKKQQAFKDFVQACCYSKIYGYESLDAKLRADAHNKAISKMRRVVNSAQNMAAHAAMNSWSDFTAWSIQERKREEKEAALKAENDAGYSRARNQFEGEILDLRDALKHERGLSFYAHLDSVLVARAQQGKLYGFSSWRQAALTSAAAGDNESAKAELAKLKASLAASDGNANDAVHRVTRLEQELRGMKQDKQESEDDYFARVKSFERDLEQVQRDKENQLGKLILDNKHLKASLEQARLANEAQTDEHTAALMRERKGKDRLIADKSDMEQDNDHLSASQRSMQQKNRDMITDYENKLGDFETSLAKSNASENLAKRENEVVMRTLDQVHGELAEARANVHTLEDRLADQGIEVERYVSEQRRVIQRLKAAEEALAVYEATGGSGGGNAGLGAIRQDIITTQQSLQNP